ncbi:MAG: DUF1080 domain-containing protein [Acidobacteria bacterium]|nr:DUF1080 domain-containing protein [Acidobacteriota bacterium]
MTKSATWCAALVLVLGAVYAQAPATRVPLFDGRTLTGWTGDIGRTWRVEDGAIVGGSLSETVPRNEFLTTTREYADFVLRLQFKLEGSEGFINAGVQFRSRRLEKPAHEMIGYQADIGANYWGGLYDESRRNVVLALPDQKAVMAHVRIDDWNDYEIRAEGRRIRLTLNGHQTVDYTEADTTLPQTGLIGLQIHGDGKALVRYRNITIDELP